MSSVLDYLKKNVFGTPTEAEARKAARAKAKGSAPAKGLGPKALAKQKRAAEREAKRKREAEREARRQANRAQAAKAMTANGRRSTSRKAATVPPGPPRPVKLVVTGKGSDMDTFRAWHGVVVDKGPLVDRQDGVGRYTYTFQLPAGVADRTVESVKRRCKAAVESGALKLTVRGAK